MAKKKKEFYMVSEVATILGVSVSTVHRYLDDNLLSAYRPGGRGPWRVTSKSLEDFQENHVEEK